MKTEKYVIMGSGALAREVVRIFHDRAPVGFDCIGSYVDPAYVEAAKAYGLPVLKSREEIDCPYYFLGVGEPKVRVKLVERARELGLEPLPGFSYPKFSSIAGDLVSGSGSGAAYGAVVESAATIGSNVLLMYNVVIGHDVRIGNNVVFAPGAVVGGNATIGDNVFFGSNAVVLPGVTIGEGCQIASGAVCFRDVPPDKRVLGNPGRTMDLVTESVGRREART